MTLLCCAGYVTSALPPPPPFVHTRVWVCGSHIPLTAFYDAVHGLPTPHNTLLKIEQPSPVGAFVSVGQSEFADTVVDAFYDSIDFVATDEDAEDWPDLNGKDFEKQFDDFLDIYLEENKRLGRVELGGQEILTKADTLLALDADTIDDEQPAGEVAAFDVSVPQEDVFEGVAQDDMMAMLDEMTYNPDKFEVRRAQMVAEDPALAHFLSGLDDLLESFNSASSGREEREWEDFVEQNSALVPDGVDAPDIDELRDMYVRHQWGGSAFIISVGRGASAQQRETSEPLL